MSSNKITVETFSLSLRDGKALLSQELLVETLEAKLLQALPRAVRLLRWAIVQVEDNCLHCEGAYLKTSP